MQKELIVGNTYYGFRLVDKRPCPDYRGNGYLFRHEKTKMEVYFLSCDNTEYFFSYTIYTPPEDDTGVFHILEHTVLTGSRKYPVRDPFMALNRNSCNTFLNAMTAPDRTDYPAASPVKKDILPQPMPLLSALPISAIGKSLANCIISLPTYHYLCTKKKGKDYESVNDYLVRDSRSAVSLIYY